MNVSAYAPVSIGNFIVGFDVLGAALAALDGELFGDIVHLEPAPAVSVAVTGPYASVLPPNPADNIVAAAIALYGEALAATGRRFRGDFRLVLEKRLPVGSGLGSSAASIVAALAALNAWHEDALDAPALLGLAGRLEGRISGGVHYDNVAPSLLGGLQLVLPGEARCQELALPAHWRIAVHYPGIEVSTRAARAILPDRYARRDMVSFGQHLAAFVAASCRGDEAGMLAALRDELIVPHRAALVPGYAEAERAAREAGALAFGLSGSGPTVFALAAPERLPAVAAAMAGAFPQNAQAFTRACALDRAGARCL